ncbi:hypothetical protein HanPSC8_Chr10g0419961 [Helianthus annuus]|nr:hypothetical protein HanPSC8_Chr10g0419961 [Helianthus annuus]
MDQPMEDPVDPVDPVDPIDPEFDFEMAFDDPEPAMAPEQAAALDPVLEHDPVHVGIPIEPVIADPPADDHPVDAPLLEGDHVIAADHVDPPLIADAPVDPLVAPHPDPIPVQFHRALFEAQRDPRDEHAQHGWIPADDEVPPIPPHTTDARHVDFSFPVPQFTPPARPGEGSSAHPLGMCRPREPFLWSSPPVMPPTDPYHPFHMGYSIEDILISFVFQHEAHTRRIEELERAQPPCQCQGQTHSPLQPSRPLPPDYAARLFALEQQVASFLRTQRAMEEDWLQLRRLFYTHFPPPPPPSV